MILADTSIWAAFFRGTLPQFSLSLQEGQVVLHQVVIGELAAGNLPKRDATLHHLLSMPRASNATFGECLDLIEKHRLNGLGIGWSDVQILASARLDGLSLWTLDTPLRKAAARLAIPLARHIPVVSRIWKLNADPPTVYQ